MKHVIICLVLIVFSTRLVQSQNVQYHSVDIPNSQSFYAAQKQTNWCWAACNQMLLNAIGVQETQDNQVLKLFGRLVNQGAGPSYELAKRALGGTYDLSGQTVRISTYVSYLNSRHTDDPTVIIDHLNNGIPLVMATSAHGRVCVGVDYATNGSQYQITKIRVLDPNPATSGKILEYSMQQFLNEGLIGFMTLNVR